MAAAIAVVCDLTSNTAFLYGMTTRKVRTQRRPVDAAVPRHRRTAASAPGRRGTRARPDGRTGGPSYSPAGHKRPGRDERRCRERHRPRRGPRTRKTPRAAPMAGKEAGRRRPRSLTVVASMVQKSTRKWAKGAAARCARCPRSGARCVTEGDGSGRRETDTVTTT